VTIGIFSSKTALAEAAANDAAEAIKTAVAERGEARIVAATGASQFDFLEVLTTIEGIPWGKVEMFHLDEYVGVSEVEPASFCKYLRERLINKVGIQRYHLLDGTKRAADVIRHVTEEIRRAPIDVAFAGIGENGHLAFNDPPADFETRESYIVVDLDEACRKQQLGEGWFPALEDVPRQAISMTIQQIMDSKQIFCMVPDARKANAVKACFEGGVSAMAPASILQLHPNTKIYLDADSASLLSQSAIETFCG
jgi:glucosamine-6-phosphate deaminase